MSTSITIAGKSYEVAAKYVAGHVLLANEASALNQTLFENLRNNFAAKAKEGASQADFDAYASTYEFGVRTGGGGSRDPVEVEAMNLARDAVKKKIVASGKKVSDFTAAQISTAAGKLVEINPDFRAKAKERVEQMQSIASDTIDDSIMEALAAAPAETEGTPAPSAEGEGEAPASDSAPSAEEAPKGRGRKASAE